MDYTQKKDSTFLVIGHYFILSLGLLALGLKLSYMLGHFLVRNMDTAYLEWAKAALEIEKPAELLAYIFPLIGLFVYYLIANLHFHKKIQFRSTFFKKHFHSKIKACIYFIYLACLTLLPIYGLNNAPHAYTAAYTGILLTLFILPFWNYLLYLPIGERILKSKLGIFISISLSAVLIIQLCLAFLPYLPTGKLFIENDFLGIPEQTKLENNYVDNLTYINAHRIGGLLLYDPHRAQDQQLTLKTAPYNKHHKYTPQEVTFAEKNAYELVNQMQVGHYFHHHNSFLGPINEFHLNKSQKNITFQYGWLNTVLLSYLINNVGHGSFAHYIKITYAFYPIYYALLMVAGLILFKNGWKSLVIGLASLGSLYLISYEGLHMAPGFNPVRHFFDIFVLISFYLYLFSSKHKILYLLTTVGFSILMYLCNSEFGLFAIAGLSVALFSHYIQQGKITWKEVYILAIGIMTWITIILCLKTGKNSAALYYFSGVTLPKTSHVIIRNCMFLISIIYTIILFFPWPEKRWKTISIFLFIYAQSSLIYFIWNPSPTHLYSTIMPWVFLIMTLYSQIIQKTPLKRFETVSVFSLSLLCFFLIYTPARQSYMKNQLAAQKTQQSHKIYDWNMPYAQFSSTMNPAPFENALALIQKYAKGNNIQLLSKYDNFIPLIAHKYNLLPFLQTDTSIVTNKELDQTVQAILQNTSSYLFIDSDIFLSRKGDQLQKDDAITKAYLGSNAASLTRVQVLNNLNKIAAQIHKQYKLVESGQLISVYKHI